MEAEKSHDLPYASWRPRRAGGVIPVQTRMSENQESQWYKAWSKSEDPRTRNADIPGQEKMDVPAQAGSELALFPPLCSIQALNKLDDAHPNW